MKKPFNWKIFWILAAASALGLIAVVPYTLALQAKSLQNIKLPMPLPLLVTVQLIPQIILYAILAALGLWLTNRIGLGLPILEAVLRGEPVGDKLRRVIPISVILGVLASLIIIALDTYVFQPAITAQLAAHPATLPGVAANPVAWKGFLASFYGGIDEEILLRLFVMSLLA